MRKQLIISWFLALPLALFGAAVEWVDGTPPAGWSEVAATAAAAAAGFGVADGQALEVRVGDTVTGDGDLADWTSLGEAAATRRGRRLTVSRELVAAFDDETAHASNLLTRKRFATGVVLYHALRYWDERAGWSKEKQFRRLAGWAPVLFGWEQLNRLAERSPDPHEWESPAAGFAVHGTYFNLDPEYGARLPALQRWLVNRFGDDPFAGERPARNTLIFLTNHGVATDLSPEVIREVHYLLAAPGRRIESGWGHSLFRLVTGDADGEPARTAVADHLVLGYQALTMGDLRLDHLGGLTGKYPTLVFAYLFTEVYGRYVAGEYRDVKSYPLTYDAHQRGLLLDRFLEQYWCYQGAYRFLTRNCASESRDDLSAATGKRHRAMTPKGITEAAVELGFIDLSLFEDKAAAIAGGIYFPEAQDPKDRLKELRRHYPAHKRLLRSHYYLEESTAAEREAMIVELAAGAESADAVIADFYNLENAVIMIAYQNLLKEAGKILRRSRRAAAGSDEAEAWRLYQKATAMYEQLRPWNLVPTRYGIPLASEVVAAKPEREREKVLAVLGGHKETLIAMLRQRAPDEWQRHAEAEKLAKRLLGQLGGG